MSTTADDIFGNAGGGGTYPKLEEFDGKLICIEPEIIEQVDKPAHFGGKPGEMQDRLTADVTVFEDDGSWETYSSMYLSQKALVNAGRKHLKPGAKRFILGRVAKVPSQIGKAQAGKFDSTEKIEAGLAEFFRKNGKGVEKPNFAWGLNNHTEEDKSTALKYVLSKSPMANASDE